MSIVQAGGGAVDPLLIRRTGYGVVVAAIVAGLAALFAPDPLVTAADLALAVAALAITLPAPEVFEIKNRRARRPNFNPLFVAPAGLVWLGGVRNQFVDANPLLIAAAVGALVGCGLAALRMGRPGLAGPIVFVSLLTLIGGLLGFGGVAMTDVRFDTSAPQTFRTTVSSMYLSRGRSTSYYLRLPPWGPETTPNTISVTRALYDQLHPGDPVCLDLSRGVLAIPWYAARACPAPE